ncbi:PIN domain-containing protein [Streptomyces sp. NBC_01451]|uniref:PIN domain-containing protein n=1 Tax=Streptomyces sp. NBC_01451 TaxID=2903872 RepID=UPI002E372111|nr:PIN domain-containing protein [Streptomyces sp. NBC_01451]
MIRVLLDHTCIQALAEGDEFLNGLYVEASYGYAEIVIPALSAVVAERARPGSGRDILNRRFTTVADFTHAHALTAVAWRQADWRILHSASSVVVAEQTGVDATLLSLDPELYAGTGVSPLNPMNP